MIHNMVLLCICETFALPNSSKKKLFFYFSFLMFFPQLRLSKRNNVSTDKHFWCVCALFMSVRCRSVVQTKNLQTCDVITEIFLWFSCKAVNKKCGKCFLLMECGRSCSFVACGCFCSKFDEKFLKAAFGQKLKTTSFCRWLLIESSILHGDCFN